MQFISTDRLFLRNFRSEDLSSLYLCRNDDACARFQSWTDCSVSALRDFIQKSAHDMFLSAEPEQHYAVCSLDSHPVGDLSVFYNERDRCITLGITILPDFQRKGYAREILTAVIQSEQQAYPHLDLVALIKKGNLPSLHLFESLGFFRECYAESISSYLYILPAKKK